MIMPITILFTLLSACMYRLGGLGKDQAKQQVPWVPQWLLNSKTRDAGCSALAVLWMALFFPKVPWYCYVVSFGETWGMLTTYWDKVFLEDNFYAHGFTIGIAFFMFSIFGGHWIGFAIRAVVTGVLMGGLCQVTKNDWVEELGRGAFIIVTLPLMLI